VRRTIAGARSLETRRPLVYRCRTVAQASSPTGARDPAAEVERLHSLLDRHPSCLMRVGTDGTLLAVNNAALDLLGAAELATILGTDLVGRLLGDASRMWADFVHRVCEAGSGSAECEMETPAGVRRTLTLLGVAMMNHPDGLASLLVVARDISTARRLEGSLQEHEELRRAQQASLDQATATVGDLRRQLAHAAAEQAQLRAAIEQLMAALRAAQDAAATARSVLARQAQP
jgi:hypothetical protein